MTVKQEIERHEQELKELLGRVMRDPLTPVHDSVTKLDARLEELETMLQDIRDLELSTLNLRVDDVGKEVRQIKSKTGETPREVRLAVEPILQRLQGQVEQAQLATHDLLKEESKRVDDAANRLAAQLTQVGGTVSESQKTVESSLQSSAEQVEGTVKSVSDQVRAQMQQVAGDLGGRVSQQVEANEQAYRRLHDCLSQGLVRLRENSVDERKQVEEQIAALTMSLLEVRTMFAQQNHHLDILRQQQDASSARIAEQLRHATQRMGIWLFAGTGLVCLGCIGAALMTGKL